MLRVTQRFIFFHLTFHLVLKSFVRLIPYYNAYLWWSSLSAKSVWIWYFQAKRLFFSSWPRDNPSKWQSSSEQRHSGNRKFPESIMPTCLHLIQKSPSLMCHKIVARLIVVGLLILCLNIFVILFWKTVSVYMHFQLFPVQNWSSIKPNPTPLDGMG